MSYRSNMLREVIDLTSALCNDQIDVAGHSRLERLLLTNSHCLQWYVEYMDQQAELSARMPVSLDTQLLPYRPPLKPLQRQSAPIQAIWGSMANFIPTGLLSRTQTLSLLAAILINIVFVAVVMLLVSPRARVPNVPSGDVVADWSLPQREQSPISKPVVAKLIGARGCRWGQSPGENVQLRGLQVGDQLTEGQHLYLAEGLAEIRFNNGVQVVLDGPAEYVLKTPSRSSLILGRLVAFVPRPARGFTIETPTLEIIDRGTEFGVEVSSTGTTDLQVFHGNVDAVIPATGSELARTIQLSSNQAARFDGGAYQKLATGENPQRFVRSVPRGTPLFLSVVDARSSSAFSDPKDDILASAHHLIDGSGLQNESHSNRPDQTMWLSAKGKAMGEWVAFDLGVPRRLHSMKVWNYNEGAVDLFRVRGIAKADVYTSTSGKGSPHSEPAEWSLAVANCSFQPGTGTDHYNTPDVVPLGYVSARFVAIVVKSCFGDDPRIPGEEGRLVGLSEVQFFGERVDPQQPGSSEE